AVAYLQGGPDAWLPRLAAGSPLSRLPRQEAWQEIAARVGPVDGSTWELYTPGPSFDPQTAIFGIEYASGLDETVILRLVDEGGWKISEFRTSVDRFEPGAAAWRGPAPAAAAPGPEEEPATPAGGLLSPPVVLRLGGGLLALILGGIGAFLLIRHGRRAEAIAAGAGAIVVAVALGGWGWLLFSAPAAPVAQTKAPVKAARFTRLGALAPLRAALAKGTDQAEIDRLLTAPPADSSLRDIRDLWKAQYLLTEADLAA